MFKSKLGSPCHAMVCVGEHFSQRKRWNRFSFGTLDHHPGSEGIAGENDSLRSGKSIRVFAIILNTTLSIDGKGTFDYLRISEKNAVVPWYRGTVGGPI